MASSPQTGIFTEGSTHFYYLEYRLQPDAATRDIRLAIRSALAVKGGEPSETVVAFGKEAWDRLHPAWRPEGLRDFAALSGVDGSSVPSTQRDLLFWIQSRRRDMNMQMVLAIHSFMQTVGALKLDLAGFQYLDSRDLTGFIDGTANPKEEKALEAALIPEGQTGAGGSFVLSQQWAHNLPTFNTLSRTDYKENGKALKIVRRSAPYGTVGEHGLHFLASSIFFHVAFVHGELGMVFYL